MIYKNLYHGSGRNFDEFDDSFCGSAHDGAGKKGFFFTDNQELAEEYAHLGQGPVRTELNKKRVKISYQLFSVRRNNDFDAIEKLNAEYDKIEKQISDLDEKREPTIFIVNLKIDNPLIIDDENVRDFVVNVIPELSDLDWESSHNGVVELNALIDAAKLDGRDGIVLENVNDALGHVSKFGTDYIVFDNSQIEINEKYHI